MDALRLCTSATMSSSDSYNPDDESNSDTDFQPPSQQSLSPSARGRGHSVPLGLDGHDSDVADEDLRVPDSSQTRHEWLAAHRANFDPKSLQAYSGIIADIEKDINFQTSQENEEVLNVTQNGAVVWTATEKDVLFNLLDRKGKNGIREIAAAIGTKSELEVMDYLRLLHRGLEEKHLLQRRTGAVIMGDIPAAAEISEECCGKLEECADILNVKEDVDALPGGALQYGNYWIIDHEEAKDLVALEGNTTLRGNIHLAGNLLNVPTWIQLSRRFFMNFGGRKEQDNWANLIHSSEESPSITGDALMDFYALTISITRRLIQSSIFFAMARRRGAQVSGRDPTSSVRRGDVRSAIDVLNMKHDRADFLLQAARRNCLIIADIANRKGWVPRFFSYEEAEEILNGEGDNDNVDHDDEPPIETENQDGGNGEPDNTPPDPSLPQSAGPSHLSSNGTGLDPEEEHADLLDRESSCQEELKLWAVLGQPAPPHLNQPLISEEENKDATHKPAGERKSREEIVDWRDRTLYRSEWEEYGSGLEELDRELVEHRRKRRRVEDSLAEMEDESEEQEDEEGQDAEESQGEMEEDSDEGTGKAPVFRSASVVNSDESLSDTQHNEGDVDERMDG